MPRGAQLPFPGPDKFGEHLSLAVPKTAIVGSVTLRVEIVAGTEARPIFVGLWDIHGPVKAGEPLRLRFHYDENQVMHLELTLRDQPDARPFTCTIENPLTNVVNPIPSASALTRPKKTSARARYLGTGCRKCWSAWPTTTTNWAR